MGDDQNRLRPEALRHLSAEMARLSAVLASVADLAAVHTPGGELTAPFIRAIIRARRLRSEYLPGDLLGEPAWDMLLELTASRLEGARVSVSSLCIAAAVPPTTALRWINVLGERGLLVRSADPGDGRRVFIELSEDAAARMDGYLRLALQGLGAI